MSNYIEPTEKGDSYLRTWRMNIESPKNAQASITVHEEEATLKADGTFLTERARDLNITLDLEETIETRNPLTDEVVGTMTHAEVYAVLYSVARDAQTADDNKPAPVEEEPQS